MKFNFNLSLIKLIIFVPATWIFLLLINHFNSTSKFSYYKLDYYKYKRDFESFKQSAKTAKTELENWFFLNKNGNFLFDLDSTNYLCVGVISKNRVGANNENYVKQTLMSILTRVSFHRQNKIRLLGFNVEQNSSHNVDLLEFKHLIRIVNVTSGLKEYPPKIIEALDYSYCMKHFVNLNCKYSLLIEDDAILAHNWFEILDDEIKKIENSKNWLMLKLFTGVIFFNNDWMQLKYSKTIIKVIFNSIILFLIEIFILKYVCKAISKIFVIVLLINSGIQACFFNSSSAVPFGAGIRAQRTGFGSVAVLYPNQHLHSLSNYLETTVLNYISEKSSFIQPKDILMEIYRKQNNLDEMIIEPSLVQHTGLHSSLEQRNTSYKDFYRMFKSLTFVDGLKLIKFVKP